MTWGSIDTIWEAIRQADKECDGAHPDSSNLSRPAWIKRRISEALLDAGLVIVPRTAPDASFEAAWEKLRSERHVEICRRISIHDARMFFRAVWSAMICACNEGEKQRIEALHKAAGAILRSRSAAPGEGSS